jgi:glycosyltransferase
MDGRSSDGTIEVLQAARRPQLRVVSEPDEGTYDAMNKGVQRAAGQVVGTLNADDIYAGPQVLAKVVKVFEDPSVDSCYGDLTFVYSAQRSTRVSRLPLEDRGGELALPGERIMRHWRAGQMSPRRFWWGWMPPHPTFFVRKSVYEKYGLFRLDMGTAADYELMLRFLVKHRITTKYIPQVLVKMRVGGVSTRSLKNQLAANRMDRRAWEVNGLRPYPWTTWLKPLSKLPQWWRPAYRAERARMRE